MAGGGGGGCFGVFCRVTLPDFLEVFILRGSKFVLNSDGMLLLPSNDFIVFRCTGSVLMVHPSDTNRAVLSHLEVALFSL